MQEEERRPTNSYMPRKCSWTHKLLPSSDKGSVQINVAILNSEGVFKPVECSSLLPSPLPSPLSLSLLFLEEVCSTVQCTLLLWSAVQCSVDWEREQVKKNIDKQTHVFYRERIECTPLLLRVKSEVTRNRTELSPN